MRNTPLCWRPQSNCRSYSRFLILKLNVSQKRLKDIVAQIIWIISININASKILLTVSISLSSRTVECQSSSKISENKLVNVHKVVELVTGPPLNPDSPTTSHFYFYINSPSWNISTDKAITLIRISCFWTQFSLQVEFLFVTDTVLLLKDNLLPYQRSHFFISSRIITEIYYSRLPSISYLNIVTQTNQ